MSNLEHLGAEDSFCTKLYQCRTGELHRFCGKPFQFYWFWCAHCGLHQSSEATWKSSLLSRLEAEWSCLRHPGCSLARKMLARVGKLCQRNGETQWNTGMKVSPLQFGTSWHISFFSHVLSWLRKRSVHMERPESKERGNGAGTPAPTPRDEGATWRIYGWEILRVNPSRGHILGRIVGNVSLQYLVSSAMYMDIYYIWEWYIYICVCVCLSLSIYPSIHPYLMQCNAMICNVLQRNATQCNVMQHDRT